MLQILENQNQVFSTKPDVLSFFSCQNLLREQTKNQVHMRSALHTITPNGSFAILILIVNGHVSTVSLFQRTFSAVD